MLSYLQYQALRAVADKNSKKSSKAAYISKTCDKFVLSNKP